jgi:hypothetical protein
LEKARSKRGLIEEERITSQLKKNLDDTERRLRKEIKDIERKVKYGENNLHSLYRIYNIQYL